MDDVDILKKIHTNNIVLNTIIVVTSITNEAILIILR